MMEAIRAMRFEFFGSEGRRPGLQTTNRGGIDVVAGPAAVRQALIMLLSTSPGERVMRPDYGCDLNRLLFSPNDASTAGLAIHYVRRAVSLWEPRIEIIDVDAEADPRNPEQLNITLEYRVGGTGGPQRLTFSLNLLEG